jgi:hypothetical protein
MLNGKLYVINSPAIIATAMRNEDLAFEPLALSYTRTMFDVKPRAMEIISRPLVFKELLRVISTTLMGDSLAKLNVAALETMMATLNSIESGKSLVVSDTHLFLRSSLIYATTTSLFGGKSPFTRENCLHFW